MADIDRKNNRLELNGDVKIDPSQKIETNLSWRSLKTVRVLRILDIRISISKSD